MTEVRGGAALPSVDTERLAEVVSAGGLFVLTGAGMSTESGIPDYRRPDGSRRTVPMTYQEFMRSPEARRRYWARSAVGWSRFDEARPNRGHRALAELQRLGRFEHVVTQNVDGLHGKAGMLGVTELHGNLAMVVCLACGRREPRASYQQRLQALNPDLPAQAELLADGDAEVATEVAERLRLALCLRCEADTVKPDVVMFGESVSPEVVEAQYRALERSRGVLVLGSSLRVMSGYRFVLGARRHAQPVTLVGLGSMRGEEQADLVVKAALGDVLSEVCAHLRTHSVGSNPW